MYVCSRPFECVLSKKEKCLTMHSAIAPGVHFEWWRNAESVSNLLLPPGLSATAMKARGRVAKEIKLLNSNLTFPKTPSAAIWWLWLISCSLQKFLFSPRWNHLTWAERMTSTSRKHKKKHFIRTANNVHCHYFMSSQFSVKVIQCNYMSFELLFTVFILIALTKTPQ